MLNIFHNHDVELRKHISQLTQPLTIEYVLSLMFIVIFFLIIGE